jgi:hypothetical protein
MIRIIKKFIIPNFNDVLEYCMQNDLDVDGHLKNKKQLDSDF